MRKARLRTQGAAGTVGRRYGKSKLCSALAAFALAVVFSGCSVLMPYKSSFQCDTPDKGKCVSVEEAYEEAVGGGDAEKKDAKDGGEARKEGDEISAVEAEDDASASRTAATGYRDSLYRELSALIDEPVTPVVLPPKVIRILVLPYPDKSVLYMPRHVYLMVDEPEWVIGNYLIEKGGR